MNQSDASLACVPCIGGMLSPKSRRDENGRWSSCGVQCFSQARCQVRGGGPHRPLGKVGESGFSARKIGCYRIALDSDSCDMCDVAR